MNFKKIALLSTSFILTIVGCGSAEPSSFINSSSEIIESSDSISISSNESIEDYSSFIEESNESIESSNEENFLDLGAFYPEYEAEVCLASDEVQEW